VNETYETYVRYVTDGQTYRQSSHKRSISAVEMYSKLCKMAGDHLVLSMT